MSIIIHPAGAKGLSLRAKSKSQLLWPVDVDTGRMYEAQSCPTPQGGTLSPYCEGDVQDTTLVHNHRVVSTTKETL